MAQLTFAKYFQQLRVLFFALLAGQILMSVILWLFVRPVEDQHNDTFIMLGFGVVLVTALAATFVSKKIITDARDKSGLSEKLQDYRRASVLRWGLRESGVLINLILFFFVSGNILHIALAGVGILVFALLVPSKARLFSELDLNSHEIDQLENGSVLIDLPDSRRV